MYSTAKLSLLSANVFGVPLKKTTKKVQFDLLLCPLNHSFDGDCPQGSPWSAEPSSLARKLSPFGIECTQQSGTHPALCVVFFYITVPPVFLSLLIVLLKKIVLLWFYNFLNFYSLT